MPLPASEAAAESDIQKPDLSPAGHYESHTSSAPKAQPPAENSSSEGVSIVLKGCKPLTHQVAGHRFGQGNLKLGMLQHTDGSIFKPVQPPPRGDCEVKFYSKVFDPNSQDLVLRTLRPFLPKFMGVCRPITVTMENGSMLSPEYMKLEDACRRFHNPSILDIKMGRVSYDPLADAAKIAFETGKYSLQKTVGFQLLGARIPGQSPNEAIFYDKKWGRSLLTEEAIMSGLEIFFTGNKACRKHLIKAFIQRLETILIWFESQTQLQFYSSSLLLIYEGEFFDGSSDSDEEFMHKYRSYLPNSSSSCVNDSFLHIEKVLKEADILQDSKVNTSEGSDSNTEGLSYEETGSGKCSCNAQLVHSPHGNESGYSSEVDAKSKMTGKTSQKEFVDSLCQRMKQHRMNQHSKYRFPPDLVDVRMIDFTHVFEEQTKDDNYIYGLQNLIAYLRNLLKQS